MRPIQLLAILALTGQSAAQIPHVPSCSANCFITALGSDGCSGLTDFTCHCQKPDLLANITPCVAKACPAAEASDVSSIMQSECSKAGHPLPTGAASESASKPAAMATVSAASATSVTSVASTAPSPTTHSSGSSTFSGLQSIPAAALALGLFVYLTA